MTFIYWAGFALAFLSYGLDRAARLIRPEDGGDSLYLGVTRVLVCAAIAALWPIELTVRALIWLIRRQLARPAH